jgi:hypothetical protein
MMALSAKKEQITDVKLESAYAKPERVSLICTIGEYKYHVWLSWPSLDFVGGMTGTREANTVYRNPVNREGTRAALRTVYLTKDTGDGRVAWEAMSKDLPRLAEKLKADLVLRVQAEQKAHEEAVKATLIEEAAHELFEALRASVPTLQAYAPSNLLKRVYSALNKAGESF